MKKCTKMNKEIFCKNLLATLKELDFDGENPYFIIVPVYNKNKPEEMFDDTFRLCLLSEKNIGGKILPLDVVVELLTCMAPLVPTQIKVQKDSVIDNKTVFKLFTSTRMRKPTLLANCDTNHPPFKVIL